VASQAVHRGVGQDGASVLLPLPSSNCDFALFEVDVLDTELKGFAETQACPYRRTQASQIGSRSWPINARTSSRDDRQSKRSPSTYVAALNLTYETNAKTTFRYCPSVNPAGSG